MSYIVFARKWRPRDFDEVVGQEVVTTTLKNAIALNRISHAYLFSGPRGVGKTTVARIFAKALNCEKGPTAKPCNRCTSCLEITAGNSIDVLEIDGASNRGIDEIRALRENIKFFPIAGKFKIYIIDEVHQITLDAFNALLKTLEEPPLHVKFIFATTQPHKVPATIVSRCQRFDFKRLPLSDIVRKLKGITKEEKITPEEEALFTIAKAADGSMRDAEVLLDQINCATEGRIKMKDVTDMLGTVEYDILFDIADKILKNQTKELLLFLDRIVSEGKELPYILNLLTEHFRNLLIAKVVKNNLERILDLPKELTEKINKQSEDYSQEDLFYIIQIFAHTQETAKRIPSVRLAMELAFIKIGSRDRMMPINEVLNEISRLKEKTSGNNNFTRTGVNPVNLPKPKDNPKNEISSGQENTDYKESPKNCSSAVAVTLEQAKAIWPRLTDALKNYKMSCGTYFSEGAPLGMENNVLTIGFGNDKTLHKEILEKPDNRKVIEDTLTKLLKADIKVNFVTVKEELVKEAENLNNQEEFVSEDDMEIRDAASDVKSKSHPVVDKILKVFGGKIIEEGT